MVTFNQPILLLSTGQNSTYRLSWTSDQTISNANPYRVYQDGELISTQTSGTLDVRVPIGANPVFEVLDTTTAVAQSGFPAFLELGWVYDSDAVKYKIEQALNGVWSTIATIAADSTQAWQVYSTAALSDETTATWRVTPIDAAGNLGQAVNFIALMVRYPDVPTPNFVYNGSGAGTLTLS